MMGYSKLCLLILLSSYTFAQQDIDNNEQTSRCSLASRFKTNKRYAYQYTTTIRNAVDSLSTMRNGPKITCQVEIEIPQTCKFVLYTRECTLSEEYMDRQHVDPQYRLAPNSEEFRADMERNPLRFSEDPTYDVELYAHPDETTSILNIKRGIISAFMLPSMKQGDTQYVSTIHGKCFTDYSINAERDIPTDVTTMLGEECDLVDPRPLAWSPLAVWKKMTITSPNKHECNYHFDNKGKHITSATCTEDLVYLTDKEIGIKVTVIQNLSFQNSKRINNRAFDVNASEKRPLHYEDTDHKGPTQTKDAALRILRDLQSLAEIGEGHKRTTLFHKLISTLRGLRNETLSEAVTEMLGTSSWLTWQALLQCGTSECTSAILQAIRSIDGVALEVDALVYGLGLQDNPDAARVRDMLSMAQYKQSKAIMYALANTVKKFHKGEVTPVVTDVSKFMETLLQDCEGKYDDYSDFPTDPNEMSFLALRVVGVMGQAMQTVNPGLISSLMRCARNADVPLSNQKSAIQAFRLMDVTDEIRNFLMEMYLDVQNPIDKRVAAYLILMKNPDPNSMSDIVRSLENMGDAQLRSFVVSHLKNINDSEEPQMQQFRDRIFDGRSRNFKIDSPLGSVQSNLIFDGTDTLPKEVMLEATLKAFDYNSELFEVDVEGAGFEPTIEALFGDNGFFPDTTLKIIYWAGDKARMLKDVVDRLHPEKDRMKRQAPQDLLQDMRKALQKLVNDLVSSPTPEAAAYLRLFGNEIGYVKPSDVKKLADNLFMYFHVFVRILPAQAFFALTSSTDNDIFAHYMFMDSGFSLPTISGLPMKYSTSGVFAPGARGGMALSSTTGDISFKPSVGLEFITQVGVYIPNYTESGVQLHTHLYHESSLEAKISTRNHIKLSIPAPKTNTPLFSVRKTLQFVHGDEIVPFQINDRDTVGLTDCQPLISGLNICMTSRYSIRTGLVPGLLHVVNGETMFKVEIQPTRKVSEYTATLSREKFREGQDRISALRITFKAEGDDSSEAVAALKYNSNKNMFTSELIIPDYDVEAGIKLTLSNGLAEESNMRGITIDVTNRNIPQMTLVARTRLEMMRDAMLQLQMLIPALKMDASVTTNLKYDDDKFEVELKSDLNSEVEKLIPNANDHRRHLQQLIDEMLDQRVAKTDMKLRHIVTKGIEAGNIWLDKLSENIPGLANLRNKRSISSLTLPPLPDKLFLQSVNTFRYQFNKDKIPISLPLPLGGKKSQDLNIPNTLSIPAINLQPFMYIPSSSFRLPSFTIPPSLDFMMPLLGLAEASTKISSNFYSWEGSISGGNNTMDVPNYLAQYKAMAKSPFPLLEYKLEGTGMITGRADENLKYFANNSFSHLLIDTSFSLIETVQVADNLNARANYKVEAHSPLGLHASLYYSAQSTSTLNSDEVSGDGTLDGTLRIGPMHANSSYTHNYVLRPLEGFGRGESTLRFDCPLLQVNNIMQGVYANSELKLMSKTNALNDALKHVAELRFKDSQLTMKCSAVAKAMSKSLTNNIELGVSSHMGILRIESQADDDNNRAYSLLTGSLNSNGLELNSEGSLIFDVGRGLHKASLTIGRNGLTTSGTNTIQCSPITLENIFNGAINSNGASLSCQTKATAEEGRGEFKIEGEVTPTGASLHGALKGNAYDATTRNNVNFELNRRGLTFTSNVIGTMDQMKTENMHALTITLWTLVLHSKTDNFLCKDVHYKQDTKVDIKPFVMKFDVTNDLKYYDANLKNEGHLKLQPLKMDLSGSVKGAYGDDHNIQHTYDMNYGDMAGTIKCSTSGNVLGAQLSHNCELEFAGLSSKSLCETRVNSEPLRFDSTVRTMALPFSLTIDALVNGDGVINLRGKHSGQLYSKLLVKAEPLALAYSHDSRVSTTHALSNGESSTNLDNKFDGLVTPSDQALTWKMKSKMNNHAYNQDIMTYNNGERIGLEFSGVMLTDILDRVSRSKRATPETQEYSVSGFLKYDKSSDCHIIEIPFIESFPVAFEQLKSALVHALEMLQQFINNQNMNQLIADFRDQLDRIPMQVRDIMQRMDLENKVNQIKAKLDFFIDEFSITMDDLELSVNNLREKLEKKVIEIATKFSDLILAVKDYVENGRLADEITRLLTLVGNQLHRFNMKFDIQESILRGINAIEDILRQIDLEKLTESSTAWLRELDSKYGIMDMIKDKLSELKQAIEEFNVNQFFEDMKTYLLSIDVASYIEQLPYQIPSAEIMKVFESMNDVIVNWIDEYEIPNKLNAVYTYIKDQFSKYGLDDKFKDLMDQMVILIKELKIVETTQLVVDALKNLNFEFVYEQIMQLLQSVTDQLREIDFRQSIEKLNDRISSLLKSLKEFDYNAFVDEANRRIDEITNSINEQIKTYEIVEKIEAIREFFREIQDAVYKYLDKLKNTTVADTIKKLKNVIDTAFYNDVKLKIQDMLEDMRQRILDMDIRDELYIHLQRASKSYTNMVSFISAKVGQLIDGISEMVQDNEVFNQIKQAVQTVMDALTRAEIEIPAFTVPFTDLVIPAFSIQLNKLHEIQIPSTISVPEFTILDSYTIPAFTISFDEIKAKMIEAIDNMMRFEIRTPEPEDIFGDLRLLYLSDLPDVTFPEIRLSEIAFPAISFPKLNLNDFEITMLPIPEIKLPNVPTDICVPVFGKLHGELRVNSPMYTLVTTGKIENSTSTPRNPQFIAALNSHAKSPFKPLEHTFEATAQLEAPRLRRLQFRESVKALHMAFSVDHGATLILSGSSAEASARTTAKATTQAYKANLSNNMALTLKSGISATTNTSYEHNLDMPALEISSQVFFKNDMAAAMESGSITLTGETNGHGKWSILDYTDEGTHKSNMEFDINFSTAKLTFASETDCKSLKNKQTLTSEAVILSHMTVDARCETETPFVKKSVTVLHGEAHAGDLKLAMNASHEAQLTGSTTGSVLISVDFLAHPFEIVLDAKNKANLKISFPMKLTGKVDLQNDYGVILKSEKQRMSWFALGRFNQYKYNHNITGENNEMDVFFHLLSNGEANLDFLTVPLSIPEMTVPYLNMQTPELRDLSLWEHAGFKSLLTTPQQSFDLNLRLHYYKNPETHTIEMDLEPLYDKIRDNGNILRYKFEQLRDKTVMLLKNSYNQAKSQYIKHKIDTSSQPPRIFTVPGYKIPILNIEVSAFRAEMPAFSYFVPKEVSTPRFKVPALGFYVPSYTLVLPSLEVPVIHVPETLSEIELPTFTLPSIQNSIVIPTLGNITCDFSFKSAVVTVSANAGVYSQSDVVARFGASSTSVFDILNGKMDGTTSLTRKRGIKLATTVTFEHQNVEGSHECAVSLTKRSMEASLGNNVKINLPFLNLELNQELTGNTKTKPNLVSKKKIKYMFKIPLIDSVGKGNLDVDWALEALSSYVSMETSTLGKSDITIMDIFNFDGDLKNDANFYLNANGLRSTVTTAVNSDINKQERQKRSIKDIFHYDMNENFALEVSLRRVFARMDYVSNNNIDVSSFSTSGTHTVNGELDFVPLTNLKTTLKIDASQPSTLGHARILQNVDLTINSEKQAFTWSSTEQLRTLIHRCDFVVSNDESEVRVDMSGSVEGHVDFLKSVRIPIYQRTLWNVLKFDQVTNMDDLQFLNISYSVVYTKSMDGQEYAIPSKLFENGIIFSIPQISIPVPQWMAQGPGSDPSDPLTLPPEAFISGFVVPFTNLRVESFMVQPQSIEIPKEITVPAFDIMLPGLPVMSVPSFLINTEYLQGKMSFLSFKMPQYDIEVSPFTLPKVVPGIELPTITIPAHKIEIPEMTLNLPTSIFVPAFGAISATVKIASPIYNVSTTGKVERKESTLVTSLDSICTSTLIFLEYDFSDRTILEFNNGVASLNGKGNLIHNDANVNWQHVFARNLRMKRQAPSAETTESRHTLNVDVSSPTFADVSFRYASRRDGITASMSSPSAGFLGLLFQRRSPSQVYAKLFSRYLSTPEKDTDILTMKATLRNSQKFNLQTSWNLESFHDAVEGTKLRIPAMSQAMLKFINKYHTAHFEFDVQRGGMKVKNTISNAIEKAYHEFPVSFSSLQNSIEHLSDQGKDMYTRASERWVSINVQDVKDRLVQEVQDLLRRINKRLYRILSTVDGFLNDIRFTVPGSEERISAIEFLHRVNRNLRRAISRAMQRFYHLIDTLYIELPIFGYNFSFDGHGFLAEMESSLKSTQLSVEKWLEWLYSTVIDHCQAFSEKFQNFVDVLKDENARIAPQVDAVYAEIVESSKQKIIEARGNLASYKDLTKQKVQDVYNSITMEQVNMNTYDLMTSLQINFARGLNEYIELMRRASENTEPYIKMSNRKVDIEIPLPFFWKSFNEWPTQTRH